MKKITLIILILTACLASNSCTSKKEPLEIDFSVLVAEINAFIPAASLYELTDSYLEDVYGFELAKMTQYAAFKAEDPNSADEILLFETDPEYVDAVYEKIAGIQSRLIVEIENYTNNPSGMDQYSNAQSAVMIKEQNYIFFAVSEYNDDVRSVIQRWIDEG